MLQQVPGAHADTINVGGNEHPVIETRTEHVNTFAIDVDRASYVNVRRFLGRGIVPPRTRCASRS